jgi:hypothetical protein
MKRGIIYYRNIVFYILIFSIIFNSELSAQSSFISLGSSTSNQQGNLSFSVGQPSYVNIKANGGSMEFGVQQPYQYIAITAVANAEQFIDLQIFPNPTHETLSIKNLKNLIIDGNVVAQVITQAGQVLVEEKIKNDQLRIDVRNYTQGTYLLNIVKKGQLLKSYKFIKL